jgi:hypothetical protein
MKILGERYVGKEDKKQCTEQETIRKVGLLAV